MQMALKRPNAISFSKKNVIRPFEDASSLEFWAKKNDASLFVVGQTTKKRPDGLTFVRMFDNRVLDMCEVGVQGWKSMADFKVSISVFFSRVALEVGFEREDGNWCVLCVSAAKALFSSVASPMRRTVPQISS